jgi:hypothetical protein
LQGKYGKEKKKGEKGKMFNNRKKEEIKRGHSS